MKHDDKLALKLRLDTKIKDPQDFFPEFVISIASRNQLFRDMLDIFLASGGTFASMPKTTDSKIMPIAMTSRAYMRVDISHSLWEQAMTSEDRTLRAMLEVALRHELTHATDFVQLEKGLRASLIANLKHQCEIADLAFTAALRLLRGEPFNPADITKLGPMFDGSVYSRVPFIATSATIPEYDGIQAIIKCIGIFVDSNVLGTLPRYLTHIVKTGSSLVTVQRFDPIAAKRILERTIKKCDRKQAEYFIEYLANRFQPKHMKLWESLEPGQRLVLDKLLQLVMRISHNVVKDDVCYPELTVCLRQLMDACLTKFVNCQEGLPDPGTAFETKCEVNAVLAERTKNTEKYIDVLGNLAEPPGPVINEVIPSGTTDMPNTFKTSGAAMEQDPMQKYDDDGYSYSFMISFVNTLADDILAQTQLSPWKQYLLKAGLSTGLLAIIGLSYSEVAMLKATNFILDFAKQYLGLPSIKLFGINIDVAEATAASVMLYGTGMSRVAVSLLSGMMGFGAAKGTAHLMRRVGILPAPLVSDAGGAKQSVQELAHPSNTANDKARVAKGRPYIRNAA